MLNDSDIQQVHAAHVQEQVEQLEGEIALNAYPLVAPPPTALEVLRARLTARQKPAAGDHGCQFWLGAHSQSGYRGVFYPVLQVGAKLYRVNRLVLLLEDLPPEAAQMDRVQLIQALTALGRARHHFDTSHVVCQEARCTTRAHLDWETHQANVARNKKGQWQE